MTLRRGEAASALLRPPGRAGDVDADPATRTLVVERDGKGTDCDDPARLLGEYSAKS
jgi:hypothetical protein